MRELVKVFGDTPLEVKIIDDENFYVNISGIASKHGKKISRWTDGKKSKEYIKEVQKSLNLTETELIRRVGNETLIHNKLLLFFARWLSPKFAVWCDDLIYEIVMNGRSEEVDREVFKIKGEILATFDKYLPPEEDYNTINKRGMLRLKPVRGYYRADNFEDNQDALNLFRIREELKIGTLYPEYLKAEEKRLEHKLRGRE